MIECQISSATYDYQADIPYLVHVSPVAQHNI